MDLLAALAFITTINSLFFPQINFNSLISIQSQYPQAHNAIQDLHTYDYIQMITSKYGHESYNELLIGANEKALQAKKTAYSTYMQLGFLSSETLSVFSVKFSSNYAEIQDILQQAVEKALKVFDKQLTLITEDAAELNHLGADEYSGIIRQRFEKTQQLFQRIQDETENNYELDADKCFIKDVEEITVCFIRYKKAADSLAGTVGLYNTIMKEDYSILQMYSDFHKELQQAAALMKKDYDEKLLSAENNVKKLEDQLKKMREMAFEKITQDSLEIIQKADKITLITDDLKVPEEQMEKSRLKSDELLQAIQQVKRDYDSKEEDYAASGIKNLSAVIVSAESETNSLGELEGKIKEVLYEAKKTYSELKEKSKINEYYEKAEEFRKKAEESSKTGEKINYYSKAIQYIRQSSEDADYSTEISQANCLQASLEKLGIETKKDFLNTIEKSMADDPLLHEEELNEYVQYLQIRAKPYLNYLSQQQEETENYFEAADLFLDEKIPLDGMEIQRLKTEFGIIKSAEVCEKIRNSERSYNEIIRGIRKQLNAFSSQFLQKHTTATHYYVNCTEAILVETLNSAPVPLEDALVNHSDFRVIIPVIQPNEIFYRIFNRTIQCDAVNSSNASSAVSFNGTNQTILSLQPLEQKISEIKEVNEKNSAKDAAESDYMLYYDTQGIEEMLDAFEKAVDRNVGVNYSYSFFLFDEKDFDAFRQRLDSHENISLLEKEINESIALLEKQAKDRVKRAGELLKEFSSDENKDYAQKALEALGDGYYTRAVIYSTLLRKNSSQFPFEYLIVFSVIVGSGFLFFKKPRFKKTVEDQRIRRIHQFSYSK